MTGMWSWMAMLLSGKRGQEGEVVELLFTWLFNSPVKMLTFLYFLLLYILLIMHPIFKVMELK